MAKKKANGPKKQEAPRPKLGFIDQFLVLVEHLASYFELLFVYLRKKLNQSLRRTILILLIISYSVFILLLSTGFFVHAGYLGLQTLFNGNMVYSSLSMGGILLILSFIFLYTSLRKIIF